MEPNSLLFPKPLSPSRRVHARPLYAYRAMAEALGPSGEAPSHSARDFDVVHLISRWYSSTKSHPNPNREEVLRKLGRNVHGTKELVMLLLEDDLTSVL